MFVSPSTYHPTTEWVQQQARNVMMWLEDEQLACRFLIHDHDTRFTEAFDHLFESVGPRIVPTPFQAPIANAFAESWIGTLKRECLNHFCCFNLRHLDYIIQTYVVHYNTVRPHQSLGNVPLGLAGLPPPEAIEDEVVRSVRCRSSLGGLLNHYERSAA